MRLRFVPGAALLGLAVIAVAAPAADRPAKAAKDAKPTLVVHLSSLANLLEDARYLARMAGKEEEARQAEKLFQRQTGGKELEGIDVKKPMGLYGYVESDLPDSRAVLLVPVADQKAKDLPNETAAQKASRLAVLDDLTNRFKHLLDEGGEVALRLNVNRDSGDLNLALSLAGKPASTMARNIAALGKVQGLGAGLLGADSALNILVHLTLPENLRKALDPVIEEGIRKGLE